jgi:uroporphyrinogen-III decarboxylase
VKHRLQFARKHGGYIVAPSHDMPQDILNENIEAMLDVLREQ